MFFCQPVLLVLDEERGKHFLAGLTAVILEDLEFVMFAAVLDDFFVMAIRATGHCFINDRFGWFIAPPEQVEVRADFLDMVGFDHMVGNWPPNGLGVIFTKLVLRFWVMFA